MEKDILDFNSFEKENNITVAQRYKDFINKGEYLKYEGMYLNKIPSYSTREFKVKFLKPDLVINQYDLYAYDVDGYEDDEDIEIGRFMTLTTLVNNDEGEELEFIAVDVFQEECPVYYFGGHESVFDIQYSPSLDEFLKALYKKEEEKEDKEEKVIRNFVLTDNTSIQGYFSITMGEKSYSSKSFVENESSGSTYRKDKSSSRKFPTHEACVKECEDIIDKKIEEGFKEIRISLPGAELFKPDVGLESLFKIEEVKEKALKKSKNIFVFSAEILKELAAISSLEELTLTFNQSEAVSLENWNWGELAHLKKLSIYIYRYELQDVLKGIEKLTNLEKLELDGPSKISSLKGIGSLKKLKELILGIKLTAKFSFTDIYELENLETLTLYYQSDINELPEDLSSMKKLNSIILDPCKIKKYPPGFVLSSSKPSSFAELLVRI